MRTSKRELIVAMGETAPEPEPETPSESAVPTMDNTRDEIVAYLDSQGITYSTGNNKTELLALIP